MEKYRVTCKKCKGSDELLIDNQSKRVMFTKHLPIIAARFRPDENWGFECQCGNDSRLAPQEKKQANVLISGATKQTIKQIIKNLEIKPNTRFEMEAI